MIKGEKFNTISHLIGTGLAIAGASVLITMASLKGDFWKIISFSVYGGLMIMLYLASTVYHWTQGTWKKFFQKLDHISIYLMIAGSYTPLALIVLPGELGRMIFGVVWGLAILGILQELMIGAKTRILSMLIYILMGWLIIFAIKPLAQSLPFGGTTLLVIGGAAYTLGIFFFAHDDKIKHAHGIWHLFVLTGSITHYLCMAIYVA
jgi:hemolysin III